MTWTRQNQMGDPAKIAERREQKPSLKSCVGCKYLVAVESPFDGRLVPKCAQGMDIGQRCRLFDRK